MTSIEYIKSYVAENDQEEYYHTNHNWIMSELKKKKTLAISLSFPKFKNGLLEFI